MVSVSGEFGSIWAVLAGDETAAHAELASTRNGEGLEWGLEDCRPSEQSVEKDHDEWECDGSGRIRREWVE